MDDNRTEAGREPNFFLLKEQVVEIRAPRESGKARTNPKDREALD
jgi:hypothetical protein